MTELTNCLWFDSQGEEAANFYVGILPDSSLGAVTRYSEGERAGEVMTIDFTLCGSKFVALNGGPQFSFSEAISFQVPCTDQAEVDRYWEALSEGGEEGPCGWLKDRYGLSWQVVPDRLPELLASPDSAAAARVMQAMFAMKKIVIADLEAAAVEPSVISS